jgi:hypothetical protein
MIIEVSCMLVGGLNFGLEKSWDLISDLIKKYPDARWHKSLEQNPAKYYIEI